MRGAAGAVRAEVAVEGSDEVWHAVVTAGGELFDATAPRTGPGRGRWVAAAAAAAVLVLGAATTAVLMTRPAPTPVVAAADGTVTGTPTVIINGTKVDGFGWADVEKALKRAGA